jgi:hypothetical protein
MLISSCAVRWSCSGFIFFGFCARTAIYHEQENRPGGRQLHPNSSMLMDIAVAANLLIFLSETVLGKSWSSSDVSRLFAQKLTQFLGNSCLTCPLTQRDDDDAIENSK